MSKDEESLRKILAEIQVGHARRHIFLCTHGKCAPEDEAQESWKFLKKRLKELGLADAEGGVLRTKADCLHNLRAPVRLPSPCTAASGY